MPIKLELRYFYPIDWPTWRDGRGCNAARRSGWDWPDNQDDGQGAGVGNAGRA